MGGFIEVFSATITRDKPGRVRGLHLQTVEAWGVRLLQSIDLLWCALAPRRDFTSGVLMCLAFYASWDHRCPCFLDHFFHSQEARGE